MERTERDISQWLTLLGRGPAVSGFESESVYERIKSALSRMLKTPWARSGFGVHATVNA